MIRLIMLASTGMQAYTTGLIKSIEFNLEIIINIEKIIKQIANHNVELLLIVKPSNIRIIDTSASTTDKISVALSPSKPSDTSKTKSTM